MQLVLQRALRVFREEGLVAFVKSAISFGYKKTIRPYLPKTNDVYFNDVIVGEQKVLDPFIPGPTNPGPDLPLYEGPLVDAINRFVEEGDRVVEVGGGWGVGTVSAARSAGEGGHVDCYEGTISNVNCVEDTARYNNMSNRITVHHGVVGPGISLVGSKGDPSNISPSELPDSDVLILDCEGAEIEILTEMTIRPRTVIVETHGHKGAATEDVKQILEEKGYQLMNQEIASRVEKSDHPIGIGTEEESRERDNYILSFEYK